MKPGSASRIIEDLPQRERIVTPSLEFARSLNARYETEVELLRRLNPVQSRPYEQQQRTIGERVFELDDPSEVMEYNRTCMNIWLFDLVADASTDTELTEAYDAFIDCQKKSSRLPPENILPFEYFKKLKGLVDGIPSELQEVFRAGLIYGDLGKSLEVQTYVRDEMGHNHANHDRILMRVMRDRTATETFMPSLLAFDEDQQEILLAMNESGFHLGQYQKFESLPVDLESFVELPPELRDMIMLNGLFDIAGAQGDRVQNGSVTLTKNTFEAFWQARESFQDMPEGTLKEKAMHAYSSYMEARNQEHGFDLETPEGEAFTRYVSQLRVLRKNEIAMVPEVFEDYLSPETRILFVNLLTQTGYEPEGAIWFEYGPASARNVFNKIKIERFATLERVIKSGDIDAATRGEAQRTIILEALMHSMTIPARLRSGARKLVVPNTVTIVNASQIAHTAENDLVRILTEEITIDPVGDDEGMAKLEPVPQATIQERLTTMEHLRRTDGVTLYIGAGGGSDCDTARIVAETIVGDKNAPVVSFPGVEAQDIHGYAEQIAPNVYLASDATYFTGKRIRSFEKYAVEGGPCYIISGTGEAGYAQLDSALEAINRHVQETTGQKVTQVVTVDTAGDVFEPTRSGKPMRRDHHTLAAAGRLAQTFGIEDEFTVVVTPGPDAPKDLGRVTAELPVSGYDMAPHAEEIIRIYESRGWPTAHPTEYSQRVETTYRLLRTHQDGRSHGIEPLSLPPDQVLTRPAFAITSEAMMDVLLVPSRSLRARVLPAA